MDLKYSSIEEALDELRNGRLIMVIDDPRKRG